MNLNYSLNQLPFTTIGLFVAESSGVLDAPGPKEYFSVDWPDANGQVLDLSRPRYKERVIQLECVMLATSPENLATQLNALYSELRKAGTQRLRINPIDNKPLVFEVYLSGSVEVKKKWRNGKMQAFFKLELTEPQPVKRVLIASSGTVSLVITALTPISIAWGDGLYSTVPKGTQTSTHSYPNAGPWYVIASGDLATTDITSLVNLTTLWT